MRVVDLRPSRPAPQVELVVAASPAAELLRSAAALAEEPDGGFDVGTERLDELRGELGEELHDAIAGRGIRTWLLLTMLVGELEDPCSVEELLTLLDERRTAAWRALVANACVDRDAFDATVLDRYLAGELGRDAMVEHVLGVDPTDVFDDGLVRDLLDEDPAAFGTEVLGTLRALHAGVGSAMLAEAAGPMERDAAARRTQLDDGRPVNELVLEATNGYELSDDLPIDRLLLLPSYWFRPWLIIARHGRTEVLTSPVADEHLALPSQAPPPALVKVCKALGDEGRLRLLRRMTGGPISLSDAMGELDVAKTTAHHHLSILRQAGLVVIRGEGRDTCYGLRVNPPVAAGEALAQYLGTTPAGGLLEDAVG